MPLRLYLIRHGETEWSISRQHTSRTDIPLTGRGEQDPRQLGEWLHGVRFSRLFTSPRQRAQRSCALLRLSLVAEMEPDLAEWDYGAFEGLNSVDIRKAQPNWNLFRDGCPGGETPAHISDRADRLIARLRLLDGNVALVSHGHFGRVMGVRWIGLPVIAAQHFQLSTASFSILHDDHDHSVQPTIALWNAAACDNSDASPGSRLGDTRLMSQRALERWENEGGEIPGKQQNQTGGKVHV
jgi:probable phosphoglycerate mutase